MDWPKMDWPKLVKSGWPKRDWPKSVPSVRDAGTSNHYLTSARLLHYYEVPESTVGSVYDKRPSKLANEADVLRGRFGELVGDCERFGRVHPEQKMHPRLRCLSQFTVLQPTL